MRRERIARIAADERATILYEAPGRVAATLAELAAACGGDRSGAVCRELTKLHETISRGTLAELSEAAGSGAIPARGEFVLVVGSGRGTAVAACGTSVDREQAARLEVERLVATGSARGDAARRVAAATGISRRKLYGTAAGRSSDSGPA